MRNRTTKARARETDAGLNPQQREAVRARQGPLIVLAGAGSGKTRVLTHRVAHHVATGKIEAASVLAITFTNRAAEEMAQRVAMLVEERSAAQMTIGTFHAVCHRLLRPNAELVGRSGVFSIYDELDARRVMARALERSGSHLSVKEVQRAVALCKSRLLGPRAFRELEPSHYGDEIAEAWEHYDELLERSDALDFEDLIGKAVGLVRSHREVRRRLQQRFRLVVVDEFQDTSPAQYAWLAELCATQQNVTVVGDDDQAIYGFRGADALGIARFERDFEQARVIKLERNYRSTPEIVEAANRLVSRNRARKGKRLWSAAPPGPKISVEEHSDERAEARSAARWCRSLIDGGTEAARIAVLYRTARHGRAIEEALVVAGIAYRVLGGGSFFDHREVKDALAYLALAVNPRDVVAFARAVAAPKRGVGERTIARVDREARMRGQTLVEVCRNEQVLGELTRPQREGLGAFAAAIERVRSAPSPSQAVIAAVRDSGLAWALRQEPGEEKEERLARLRDVVRTARAYERSAAAASIADFLAQARLVSGHAEKGAGNVALSTVHMAKGLEWECVRVVGLEEGGFPHHRSLATGGEEEERRLGYVAITRARYRLVLSWAKRRQGRPAAASRFIGEARAA